MPYFLLDRPEQAARLVQVDVVGPAVDRRKTLVAGAAAAASVTGAVGAGAVPGHADEQTAVMAPVGRPPVLRVGHQRAQILLQSGQIKLLEFFGIVEIGAHRVGLGGMLVQDIEIHLIRPPILIGYSTAGSVLVNRALAFFTHGVYSFQWLNFWLADYLRYPSGLVKNIGYLMHLLSEKYLVSAKNGLCFFFLREHLLISVTKR